MHKPPSEYLREEVQRRQEASGLSQRAFERSLGLKDWSLKGLFDRTAPRVPSVDNAKEIASALGLELRIGPPSGPASEKSMGMQEAPPAGGFVGLPVALGYVTIAWHPRFRRGAIAPIAFSRAWIDSHQIDPVRHLLVVVGNALDEGAPVDTLALVDVEAERRGGPMAWVLQTGPAMTEVVDIQFTGGRTIVLPSPGQRGVRILRSGISDPNLLGGVVWLGRSIDLAADASFT